MDLGTLSATLIVNTTDLDKAVKDLQNFQSKAIPPTKRVIKQLEAVSTAVKGVVGSTQTLAAGTNMRTWEAKMLAATNKMVKQLGRVNTKLKEIKTSMAGVAAASATMGAGAMGGGGGIRPPAVNLGSSMAQNLGAHLDKMTMRLRSFGWLATTTLTMPFVMGGKAISQMGMDFEFAMSKIEGLVGIAKGKVDQWSEALLDMGKTTARGPMELADTLYYVSSAGFKTDEALRITEMAAKGAATGLGETRDIANFLTSAMNAYRASGLGAAKAMDILTAAVREGKGEPAEMSRALGTILPIAAELGVSLDQVAGALASMTLITSSTANAATYLRNVLMKMMKPSVGTQKALQGMGTSIDELQKMLREKGLMPTLVKLKQLTDKYGESMANVFPNIRALLGALNLTGQNLKYNEQVMAAVTASMGDFEKAFFISSQTMSFKWNATLADAKAALISLGISIARELIPIFEGFVERIKNAVKWFNSLSDSTQSLIVKFGIFLALLGPMSLLLSTISMLAKGVVNAFSLIGNAIKFGLGAAAGWIAGIAAIVGWLAAVIIGIVRIDRTAIRTQKELEDATKRVSGVVSNEISKLNYLFDRARKTAEGSKERASAIKQINDQYSSYLPNLNEELKKVNNLDIAQRKLTESLVAYIKVKEYSAEMETQLSKIVATEKKEFGGLESVWGKVFGETAIPDFQMALMKAIDDAVAVGMEKTATGQWKSAVIFKDYYSKNIYPLISEIQNQLGKGVAKQFAYEPFSMAFGAMLRQVGPIKKNISELNSLITTYRNQLPEMGEDGRQAFVTTTDAVENLAGEVESFSKIMQEYHARLKAIEYMKNVYDKLGISFDVTGEKQKLMLDTMEKLIQKGGEASIGVQEISNNLRDLEANTFQADEAFKNLESRLAVIESMRGIAGMTFDYGGEKIKAVESALSNTLENIQKIKETKGIDYPIEQKYIDRVEYLNQLLNTFKNERDALADTRAKRLLEMEADAFGGLAGQIEIVNFEIKANERQLRSALERGVDPYSNSIQYLVGIINNLKDAQSQLQAQMELQTFHDMNDQFGDLNSTMNLLEGNLKVAKDRMEFLSKTGRAGSEEWENLAEKVTLYRNSLTIFEAVEGALSDVFQEILDGGANMGEVLGGIMKKLAADLMAYLTKLLLMRMLLSIFKPLPGVLDLGDAVSLPTQLLSRAETATIPTKVAMAAEGGVVPPGFPRDSYPAMLSSNEAIIPLDKLEKQSDFEGEVIFTIGQDELVGILKKATRKNKIY